MNGSSILICSHSRPDCYVDGLKQAGVLTMFQQFPNVCASLLMHNGMVNTGRCHWPYMWTKRRHGWSLAKRWPSCSYIVT